MFNELAWRYCMQMTKKECSTILNREIRYQMKFFDKPEWMKKHGVQAKELVDALFFVKSLLKEAV